MPRTAIPVQELPGNGGEIDAVSWTNADFTNGMEFENDGRTILLARNANAATRNVVVDSVPDPYGRVGDVTIGLAAVNGYGIAGPFPGPLFNQGATGKVNVDPSANAASSDFQVAAVRLPVR